jgi:hypothetical protein
MKDISVEEVGNPIIRSLAGRKAIVEIEIRINNPTGNRLFLKKGEFDVFRNGYTFGKARLLNKTEIPEHSNDYHPVSFEISITDTPAIMTGKVREILSGSEAASLTFSGYIKGGTKLISKKFNFENEPLFGTGNQDY